MNYTENVIQPESQFSFSGLNKFSAAIVSDERIIGVKQRANDMVSFMKHAINNFLKTPEEIEEEFCLVGTSYFAVFPEQNLGTGQYDTQSKHKDGFMNIHNPEEVFNLSGFMEENY